VLLGHLYHLSLSSSLRLLLTILSCLSFSRQEGEVFTWGRGDDGRLGHGVSAALSVAAIWWIASRALSLLLNSHDSYVPFFLLGQWLEVRSPNYSIVGRASSRTGDVWVLSYSRSHWKWYVMYACRLFYCFYRLLSCIVACTHSHTL
jgi:hypothetical protein